MALDLGLQLDEWAKKTEARMLAVYKGSVQEFVSRAQRRIPVDTGFARSSIRGSLEAMPQIDPNGRGQAGVTYKPDMTSIILLINSVKAGQTIYIGWTANYVPFLEYGYSNQAPNGFIGITELEWPNIVASEIEKAKANVAS